MVLKVLIVEDNFIIQMFLESSIEDMGHTISGLAADSNATIKCIEEVRPDIIFLDIGLAGDLDGIATARVIKSTYDIPIVFITGNSDEDTIRRAQETEPVYILYKPIDEFKLATEFEKIAHKIQILKSGQGKP